MTPPRLCGRSHQPFGATGDSMPDPKLIKCKLPVKASFSERWRFLFEQKRALDLRAIAIAKSSRAP